ncbi:uncharacterized protein LOC124181936 [Neodiprion fabricii]|uniref:uncharacterized protein LOC124181936 n=1 Tax=Neodiprion fabricii TaxID=2872261 RepID=UPI001ED92C21|nr:uncharacterized protein LOC124181936 [Neodiprion fabricii]
MVMAGNENGAGPATEEPLTSRLQWLQQRRQALQEKLIQKNNELKNICIDEAELTGILPPEIPLEPGESPPSFRRRVGTAFTYPQNLINKLKTTEAEESALELERQVQVGIAEAALSIFNDAAESKAVRRKHRLVYQQSQRRLQELDVRLNFVRQAHGKSQRASQVPHVSSYATQPHPQRDGKHRIKKPRPPLESTGSDRSSKSARGLLQEGGVSLSPLGQENNYNTYPGTGYQEPEHLHSPLTTVYNQNRMPHPIATATTRQQSPKLLVDSDLNDNHNVYILPDQYRARTYSHGSGGSRNPNHYLDAERNYRPVPNTYTEQERLLRYRQLQLQQQHQQQQQMLQNHQQYPEYKIPDNEILRFHSTGPQFYSEMEGNVRRYVHTPDYQPGFGKQQQPQLREMREMIGNRVSSRSNGPPNDPHQPPGYWMRYEDEIIWFPDEQPVDKFGSLDRRKRHSSQHAKTTGGPNSADHQIRYHTVAGSKSTSLLPRHNVPLNPPQPEQTATQSPSRMLLRTQSLGSVETWNSGQSQDSQDKDTTDNASSKGKEKGWYETSLDSGSSPPAMSGIVHRPLIGGALKTKPIARDASVIEDQKRVPQSRYHQPQKIFEIPAESKLPDNNNERTLESPKNCTVVQAGKYQPYREVTKPFEMSDFYKYSTKYRKRNENAATIPAASQSSIIIGKNATIAANTSSSSKLPQDPRVNMMIQMSQELRLENLEERTVPSPVQKRIYQPLQRMTCQPYNALRPEEGGEEWYVSEKEAASSATLV